MSDPVEEALAARAKGAAPVARDGDEVERALESRAASKPKAPKRATSGMPGTSTLGGRAPAADLRRVEAAATMGTGMVGTVAGGLHGAGALIRGYSPDEAAQGVQWWQDALTYQPRTPQGAEAVTDISQAMSSPLNPLSWPGHVGEFLGGQAEESGMGPGISTIMRMAPETATAILGAPGKLPAAARQSLLADAAGAKGTLGKAFDVLADARELPATGTSFGADTASAAAASRIDAAHNASPELIADLRAQVRKGPLNPEAVDRQIDADSLPIRMRLTEGQASQEPSVLSVERNDRGKNPALAARYNEQNQQLVDNLDEFRSQVAPQAVAHDPVQSGQNIIDAYKQYDEAVRADINAKYQALRDAAGGDFPVNGQAFVTAADRALKSQMKGRYVPGEIAADMAELRDGGSMTFEQFENMRTNLAAEARKADRSGDGNAAAAINIVREALESLPLEGASAQLKPLADAARQAAKARFDRLRADPAYKASVEDDVGVGEASALADNFVQKYVVKGKGANVQRMLETLGADELAAETIRASGLNYLKSRAGIDPYTNEGNFSQDGYNKALAELTPKLERLVGPEMAEQLQRLGRVARAVQARPAGSFVNESNTFTAAAGEGAKSTAEGIANQMAFGVPVGTWTRMGLQSREAAKITKERLRPAAGTLAPERRQ
jgi:hypothetical protein